MRWGKQAVRTALVALGCALLWAQAAFAAPPANDNFANATVIAMLPASLSTSNVEATEQPGEPWHGLFGAGRSIWFSWEASFDGFVTVGTCGSAISTWIGVYTGDAVDDLTEVETSDGPECADLSADRVTFEAVAGTTYAIAVDGDAFFLPDGPPPVTEGAIQFQLEAVTPPPNDDFANPTPVFGRVFEEPGGTRTYFATSSGSNVRATKQAGEPDHAGDPGGASVWYSWTAPDSGVARISAFGQPFQPVLGAYTGDDLTSIVAVGGSTALLQIPVEAGRTYRIAVDGKFSTGSGTPSMAAHELMVFMQLPPGPGDGDPSPPTTDAAPETTVTKKRVNPGRRSATFRFAPSEPGTFLCQLDKRPFTPCRSPKTYRGLKPGRHTFQVVAVDAAGNRDASPATARFRIPKPKSALRKS